MAPHEKTKIAIELKDVGFSYANNPVLEHVSFQILDGDYVGIIGPNGGGKTTVLSIILGLLQPQSGTVRIFGHTLEEAKEHYEIGYVPQKVMEGNFSFPATVKEVVESGRTSRQKFLQSFTAEDKKAIQTALEMTGVDAFQDKRIEDLSGGQKQLVFIARALAREPRILILDEPTVGVDARAQERFYSFLSELNKKFGMTILMVSHDIDVMVAEAKQVLCLNRTLVCHVPSKKFDKEEYVESLYGGKAKPLHHHHP